MRVRLERPTAAHRDEFIAAVERSRALHGAFVAPPDTRHGYRRFLRQARLASEARFLCVTTDAGALAGVVTIGGIVREPLGSGSLGYYAFVPHAGRGLMLEAVGLAITYAFARLGLERLEASIRPDNARSRRLAGRLGFAADGRPPHEVRIDGRWYAHERWALYADEWGGGAHREGRPGPGAGAAGAVELDSRRQTQ